MKFLAPCLEKNKNLIKNSEIRCSYCFCYHHRLSNFQDLSFYIFSVVLPRSNWCDLITELLNPWSLGYISLTIGNSSEPPKSTSLDENLLLEGKLQCCAHIGEVNVKLLNLGATNLASQV